MLSYTSVLTKNKDSLVMNMDYKQNDYHKI